MRLVITDMPRGTHWNSVHRLPDILDDLRPGALNHETKAICHINHLQEYFLKFMLIMEFILHPTLKGQVFDCQGDHIEVLHPNTIFYTNILKPYVGLDESTFLGKGFIKVPTLKATLKNENEVWYHKNNLVICMSEKLEWEDLFKILAFRYTLITNYYKDMTPNEDLINFYKSLVFKLPADANKYLNNILESKAYKEAYFIQFKSYFKIDTQNEIATKENDLKEYNRRLSDYLIRYAALEEQIARISEEIEYLRNKPCIDNSEEVIKYIQKNPYITRIVKVSNTTLRIYLKAPILYYDKALVQQLKDKTISEDSKLFYDIFLTDKYTLWTRCAIDFNTTSFGINPCGIGGDREVIGHPHIDEYSCTGNHPREIKEWLHEKDHIGAITQICAAALNLNFYDGTVINTLKRNLDEWNDIPTFKNNETGEMVTYKQILEGEE